MRSAAALCALALLASSWSAQESDEPPLWTDKEIARLAQHSPLPPPPSDPTNRVADDEAAAWFGQVLFFEPRLSRDERFACSTCHDPAQGFSDGKPLVEGRVVGTRHTPSLVHVGWQRWFFWDGRKDTLWSQALSPIENPTEMDGNRMRLAHLVCLDAKLRRGYERVFGALSDLSDLTRFPSDARPLPESPTHEEHRAWQSLRVEDREAVDRIFSNLGKALAAFERKLASPRSPFDVFVEGLVEGDSQKRASLSASAQRGARLFIGKADCRLCHSGPLFSDGEFHSTGIAPKSGGMPKDPGRREGARLVGEDPFNAAGKFSDALDGAAAQRVRTLRAGPENWGEFKTPSLRDVARTGPYMHQGQIESLEAVVRFYSTREGAAPVGHHQEQVLAALELTPREEQDLVAFLRSLTGQGVAAELCRSPESREPPAKR